MNPSNKSKIGSDLDWFTITYKSILTVAGIVVLLIAGGVYFFWYRKLPARAPSTNESVATTTAQFTSIEGMVKVRTVGTFEWVGADARMALRRGDLVRTGSGATAEVTFFDGTIVHVRPDSLITIEETTENPYTKERKVSWHIASGEVNFQTAKRNVQGSTTQVSTPTLTVRQGELASGGIRVAETGDSDVRIFRGASEVETKGGQKMVLATNEAVSVDKSGKAGEKINLLSAPQLLAPQHGSELPYPDPSRSTTLLRWRDVEGAAVYHVMVDVSAQFNKPLLEKTQKETSLSLLGLDVGRYFWRVSAVNDKGMEGSLSEFARFSISRASSAVAPPTLTIDAWDLRANVLQIKGRIEPGASLFINGQHMDIQADGTFNEFITFEKLGQQEVTVRAVGINGGTKELTRSVVIAY